MKGKEPFGVHLNMMVVDVAKVYVFYSNSIFKHINTDGFFENGSQFK